MVLVNIRIHDMALYDRACQEPYQIIMLREGLERRKEGGVYKEHREATTEEDASEKTKKGRRKKSYE